MTRVLTSRGAPVVLAAMAVVLGGCTSDSGSAGAAPADRPARTSEPAPDSEPTYSPGADEVMTLPRDTPQATLRQGRYAVRVTATLAYELDVPARWIAIGGRFLNAPPEASSIFFASQAPADDTWLPRHPCRDHSVTPVGPTVSDLADALGHQPVLQVSEPAPVAIDGYSGLHLEVTIPDTVDASQCADGIVGLFSLGRNGDILREEWQWKQGYVGRWWILDVDGKRIVISGQCDNPCADRDIDTLEAMAESVTFTRDG
jgi:hypothetical protein